MGGTGQNMGSQAAETGWGGRGHPEGSPGGLGPRGGSRVSRLFPCGLEPAGRETGGLQAGPSSTSVTQRLHQDRLVQVFNRKVQKMYK